MSVHRRDNVVFFKRAAVGRPFVLYVESVVAKLVKL